MTGGLGDSRWRRTTAEVDERDVDGRPGTIVITLTESRRQTQHARRRGEVGSCRAGPRGGYHRAVHVQIFERELPRCAPTIALARTIVEALHAWEPRFAAAPMELKLRGESRQVVCETLAELTALPEIGAVQDLELSTQVHGDDAKAVVRVELCPDRPSLLHGTAEGGAELPSFRALFGALQQAVLEQSALQLAQRSTQRRRISMPNLRFDRDKLVALEAELVEVIARWIEAVPTHVAAGIKVDVTGDLSADSTLSTVKAVAWPPPRDGKIKLRIEQASAFSGMGAIVAISFVPYPDEKDSSREIELVTTGLRSGEFMETVEKVVRSWMDEQRASWDLYTLAGMGRGLAGLAMFACWFMVVDSSIYAIGVNEVFYGTLFLSALVYFVAIKRLCPRVWYSEAKRDVRRERWWGAFKSVEAFLIVTVAVSLLLSKLTNSAPAPVRDAAEQRAEVAPSAQART